MARVGIVDVGSGTARLVVYEYEPGRWYRLVDEMREPVRLGEGLAESGRLAPAAMQRALAFLAAVRDYATATGLERLEAFATSAVRSAENGAELLQPARLLGVPLRVLSGEEEARYGALAVSGGLEVEQAWVMDLGGGSAQISRLEERRWRWGRAYPLGAVRLTEQFLRHDPPKAREVEELRDFVAARLEEVTTAMRGDAAVLVGMGGTVRNLARAVRRQQRYPLEQLHSYSLRAEDLEALVERLQGLSAAKRKRVAGISADRSDVIVAGALVWREVLRLARRSEMVISGFGVREGAFFRHFLPPPHLPESVRELHLASLEARFPQQSEHIQSVRRLVAELFAGLKPLHRLGPRSARLLDAAARLHDIGLAIDFYDHHKHGAYLVQNHVFAGWSHREQALLSLLVRYHRKGRPAAGAFRELLGAEGEEELQKLAVILRLAEHLERARSGRVTSLAVEVKDASVVLRLGGPENAWVEAWEAQKDAALFSRVFGRRLVISQEVAQQPGRQHEA
ncbi:Ppx/GppA phosphatase family protein [Oceanithermus sp.]